jgi:hypothetical protein
MDRDPTTVSIIIVSRIAGIEDFYRHGVRPLLTMFCERTIRREAMASPPPNERT